MIPIVLLRLRMSDSGDDEGGCLGGNSPRFEVVGSSPMSDAAADTSSSRCFLCSVCVDSRNMFTSRKEGPPCSINNVTESVDVPLTSSSSSSVAASTTKTLLLSSSLSNSFLNPALIKRFLSRSSAVLALGLGRKISFLSVSSTPDVESLMKPVSDVLAVLRNESYLEYDEED